MIITYNIDKWRTNKTFNTKNTLNHKKYRVIASKKHVDISDSNYSENYDIF